MSDLATLEGITSQMVETARLKVHVLSCGPADGAPVVFLHGNFSAAAYWEETMLALPPGFRAIAPDLRGGVLYRFLIDHPEKALSVTLVSPVSPYGFGGTKGVEGTPCYGDFAGSGGGVVNPEFVRRIKEGDRSEEDANSPRNVINTFYYVPPFRAEREEAFLTAALMEKMNDDAGTEFRYPGDFVPSENWPNVAPGVWGPINAGAPKYVLDDVPALIATQPKPPILWIRGSGDMIVSDNSMFDMGALGKLGFVPGWPGDEVYPPQLMVSQTRAVLEQYAANGGSFEEYVIDGAAHGPHIEKPDEFSALFHAFLTEAR
jgi:pimeloyl-ACP methyl ester carboxylesterase